MIRYDTESAWSAAFTRFAVVGFASVYANVLETIILQRIEEWVTLLENPIASRAPDERPAGCAPAAY
jgi:hypothetical protein